MNGLDLPCFASFPLLDTADGRTRLKEYFKPYLQSAKQHGTGFVLDTVTWRANTDWGAKLDYSQADLDRINRDSVDFAKELRKAYETPHARSSSMASWARTAMAIAPMLS